MGGFGIDLGTTYSLVAHLDRLGRPATIPNAEGELLTPSVVLLDDAGPVVGREALRAAAVEPDPLFGARSTMCSLMAS